MSTGKLVALSIALLILSLPILLLYWSRWSDKQGIKEGKRIVEELGFEYLRHQKASAHYGMYFKTNGEKYYVKYYFSHFIFKKKFSWKGPSPKELVKYHEHS